ncbi:MAG: hypothetical protein ACRDIY_18275 [Chloroflexota bacterium]
MAEIMVYRASQRAPAGEYARVDRPDVVVVLHDSDRLPPSFDGTIAHYTRIVRVESLIGA